jgi:hypothetical protein
MRRNAVLTQHARSLRRSENAAEQHMWSILLNYTDDVAAAIFGALHPEEGRSLQIS